MLIISAMIKKT